MALIKCPECQRDVSDTLKACPHCGYQFTNSKEYPDPKPDPAASTEQTEAAPPPHVKPEKNAGGQIPSKKPLLILAAVVLVAVAGCFAVMSYMQSLLPINQLSKLSAAQDYDAMAQLLADHSDDSELEAAIQAIFDTSVQSVLSDYGNDQITKEEAQQRLDRLSVLGRVSQFMSELTKIDRSRTAYDNAERYFSIENYKNAYSFYQQVCETDLKNYESSREKIEQCRQKYSEDVAGVIDEMVAREAYIEAYQYIIASDKKLLTETVTGKTAGIKENMISSALSQSETMLAAGQYSDAVELLESLAHVDDKLFQAYRKCQRQFYSDLVDRAKPNVTIEYDGMEDRYAVVPNGCDPLYVNIDYSRNIDAKLIVKSGRPLFQLCLGFEESDWIFMDEIIFDCDGEKFTWNIDYFDRGKQIIYGGGIMEWYVALHNPTASGSADKIKNLAPLVEAMIHAETVKVRFNGEYRKDVVIPSKHIAQIETIWSLYQALDFYAPLFDQLK